MMNNVVHHHPPNASHARHGENLFAAGQQLPPLHHFRVAHARQRGTCFRDVLVQFSEQRSLVLNLRRLVAWAAHRGVIQFFGVDSHRHPAGHSRDVAREPSNRTGFLMRFPIPLLVGTSFEGLAGVLHLLVELTKHHLSNGHDFLPCGIRDGGAPILGEQKANCQELLSPRLPRSLARSC